MWLDYFFIAIGFGAVLVAGYGKTFYYGDLSTPFNKKAETWYGKVSFLLVGLAFMIVGLLDLFGVVHLSEK